MTITEIVLSCICGLLASIIIYGSISRRVKKRRAMNAPTITYNPEIIRGYDAWLTLTMGIYMVRFIEETLGKGGIRDDELVIDSKFANTGIAYLCKHIALAVPDFYHGYMSLFYGKDKFSMNIYEKSRAVLIEYINIERRKRISATVTSMVGAKKQEQQQKDRLG